MTENKLLEKDVNPDVSIDAQGIHSPIPLLRLKKGLQKIPSGNILRIDCSDNDSYNDIESWCERMKHSFLGYKENSGYTSYFVLKKQ